VLLHRLANSTELGFENLAAATGARAALPDWFRDWAVANYVDGSSVGRRPLQLPELAVPVHAAGGELEQQPVPAHHAAAHRRAGAHRVARRRDDRVLPFTVPAGGTATAAHPHGRGCRAAGAGAP
jgi:hypothetical protein